MKTQKQLVNNIIGQLNGINKMMENEKDCFLVLMQMKAVKSALSSLMNKYVEDSFGDCLKACKLPKKVETMKKLLIELTKNN